MCAVFGGQLGVCSFRGTFMGVHLSGNINGCAVFGEHVGVCCFRDNL